MTQPDTERELLLKVTLKIPYFGKLDQAEKFATESLPETLRLGIGSKVEVADISYSELDGK